MRSYNTGKVGNKERRCYENVVNNPVPLTRQPAHIKSKEVYATSINLLTNLSILHRIKLRINRILMIEAVGKDDSYA